MRTAITEMLGSTSRSWRFTHCRDVVAALPGRRHGYSGGRALTRAARGRPRLDRAQVGSRPTVSTSSCRRSNAGSSTAAGLPAGPVGLQHRGEGAVEDLSRRATPGQDGDGGGVRRRVARRCGAPRRGLRPRRLFRRGRDGRAAHLPEVVSHLNWRKAGPEALLPAEEPAYDARSCSAWSAGTCASRSTCATSSPGWPTDPVRGVQARYGPTVVCGWTRIHGYRSACSATTG